MPPVTSSKAPTSAKTAVLETRNTAVLRIMSHGLDIDRNVMTLRINHNKSLPKSSLCFLIPYFLNCSAFSSEFIAFFRNSQKWPYVELILVLHTYVDLLGYPLLVVQSNLCRRSPVSRNHSVVGRLCKIQSHVMSFVGITHIYSHWTQITMQTITTGFVCYLLLQVYLADFFPILDEWDKLVVLNVYRRLNIMSFEVFIHCHPTATSAYH